jgi:ABC-2 type transport system ATP-binding protein
MEEVELLCNRVAIVDQGRIIALDTIKNLVAMLGGGVIQLGLEQLDDEMMTAIRALPAVTNASRVAAPTQPAAPGDEGIAAAATAPPGAPQPILVKIETKRSQDALVQVIGYLNERDVAFTSVEIFEPNLESVFLHLTGKKLRE